MNPLERMNDAEVAQRVALDGRQARIRTAMPGIVVSVNYDASTCTVQPAIQGQVTTPDGKTVDVNLPVLPDVPICWPRGGGFAVTFPLAPGDEVLVIIADRCIDAWWSSGKVSVAADDRMHDLSDAFAIPGPSSQMAKLSNVSTNSLQLRTVDGVTKIDLRPGAIAFTSASLTHNGINIGATHVHGGVSTGASSTGTPA